MCFNYKYITMLLTLINTFGKINMKCFFVLNETYTYHKGFYKIPPKNWYLGSGTAPRSVTVVSFLYDSLTLVYLHLWEHINHSITEIWKNGDELDKNCDISTSSNFEKFRIVWIGIFQDVGLVDVSRFGFKWYLSFNTF